MWVGFYLVNGCVTTLRLFFPSKTIQAVTPFSQTWFLHVTFVECGWDSIFFNRSCFNWSSLCEGSDWEGFLPRQVMVSSDSWCTPSEFVLDRKWLWLSRSSGKHPKTHHTTGFLLLLALLFWRSCEVLSSVLVFWALGSWGVRASCFWEVLHSSKPLFFGVCFGEFPPSPPSPQCWCSCLRVCGDGAILLGEEFIVHSERCCWRLSWA